MANGKLFDNVEVRTRGVTCAVFSVQPPFTLACWPEWRTVLSVLHLHEVRLERPEDQVRFLSALAGHGDGARNFRPAHIGFKLSRSAIRRREAYRHSYRRVVFLGKCSRQIALGALQLAASQVQPGGSIDVQVKGWDLLADWGWGSERLRDWCNYLARTVRRRGTVTAFSEFRDVPEDLWKLVYDCPNIRLACQADALAGLDDMARFQAYWEASPAAKNLRAAAEGGLWPHIVLPVSPANAGILRELVSVLLEETRGASIELLPLPFLPPATFPAHSRHETLDSRLLALAEGFTEALVALSRDPRIPRDLVAPLSWAGARMNSQTTMIQLTRGRRHGTGGPG